MLIHPNGSEPTVIDYRETAPAAADQDDVQAERQPLQPSRRRRAGDSARPGAGAPALRQVAVEKASSSRPFGWPVKVSAWTPIMPDRSTTFWRPPRKWQSCSAYSASPMAAPGKRAIAWCSPTWRKTLRHIADKGPDAFYSRSRRRPARGRDESRAAGSLTATIFPTTTPSNASRSMALTAAMTSMARRRPVRAASAWSKCSISWRTINSTSTTASPLRRCTL